MSLKNSVTPSEIDPETVRLVAQRLNHYATPGPRERRNIYENYYTTPGSLYIYIYTYIYIYKTIFSMAHSPNLNYRVLNFWFLSSSNFMGFFYFLNSNVLLTNLFH
jgi:hypothetical protein